MFADNLTRAEAIRRSDLIQTHTYEVAFDLSGRGVPDPERQFLSTSTVTFTARADGELHLDLISDELRSARLDDTDLDPATFIDSRLPLTVTTGEHRLSVTAVVRYSRSGQGVHRFVDPLDGRVYLYSQFEAADARRAYACFEQPDLKARFSIRVLAPAAWTVVSAGDIVARDGAGGGQQWTTFAETPPISTYLTSIVAGDYVRFDHEYRGARAVVPMGVLCRQSVAGYVDDEVIVGIAADGFGVFEQHFGYPYPFGKYDQVFVPEYNGGAMENIGCVTFRDEYLFRSRVTAVSTDYRRGTILHELAHMWFGNLVTMRWWDDLWLKESFATWAANFAVSRLDADPTLAWATFRSGSKTVAYRQDQLPSTHPVSADIVDLEALEHNFDQITYSKGASVLVQLVSYLGEDAFLTGCREYFAAHAYANTSLSDLLAALEHASGRDLSSWSEEWLETAGVNTLALDLETDDDQQITVASVVQTAPEPWPTLRHHRIALGLYALDDSGLVRADRVELDVAGDRTPVPELVGKRQPDVIVVNDDDMSYAKVRLDPQSVDVILGSLETVDSALSRAVLWGALWDACRDAELPAERFVELVLRAVLAETGLAAVSNALGQAATAIDCYVPVADRERVHDRWQTELADLVGAAPAGSDHQLSLARAFVGAAEPGWGGDRLSDWQAGTGVPTGLEIDTDFRWSVVAGLARLGELDDAAITAELTRDGSITGTEQAAGARAARPDAEAKATAWRLAVDEDGTPNATQGWICLRFWQRGQDEVLAPYIERYFRAAEDISSGRGVWASKGATLRRNVLRNLFPWPADLAAFLTRLDAWLASAELNRSTLRVISERRDDVIRSLACQRAAGG